MTFFKVKGKVIDILIPQKLFKRFIFVNQAFHSFFLHQQDVLKSRFCCSGRFANGRRKINIDR